MTNKFKSLAKGGIATASLGAMALAGATPAQARDIETHELYLVSGASGHCLCRG